MLGDVGGVRDSTTGGSSSGDAWSMLGDHLGNVIRVLDDV